MVVAGVKLEPIVIFGCQLIDMWRLLNTFEPASSFRVS